MKRLRLTKQKLLEYGITNVTQDGRVFKGDKECSYYKIPYKQKAKGTVRHYLAIQVYDKDLYQKQKQEGAKYCVGIKNILLHRVVYAWFYDICPRELDIDHIDNNPFNNAITNLQALTRLENNRRKSSQRNQHNYKWTEEQMKEYKETQEEWKRKEAEAKWQWLSYKDFLYRHLQLEKQVLTGKDANEYIFYKGKKEYLRDKVKTMKNKLSTVRKEMKLALTLLKQEFNKGE